MAEDLHFSAYDAWVEKEGLPVYTGWGIHPPDLELAPWDRKGVNAAILHLEAMGDHCNDLVMEIPAGGSTKAIRQMFEEVVYILSGRGATTVSAGDGRQSDLRVAGGEPLRRAFELPSPALQRLGR